MKNFVFLFSILLLLGSCNAPTEQDSAQNHNPEQEDSIVELTEEQYKNAGVDTGKILRKKMAAVLHVHGKIEVAPQSKLAISAPMGGYLKSTRLMNGMFVQKGAILAVLEDLQYIQLQEDYLIAKAQLQLAESEYKRQKELNQSKASSDKVFEQSKASYQTQNILVNSLAQKLRFLGINPQTLSAANIKRSVNVYAPSSGYVSAVNVHVGNYVNPNDVVFELVNPSDIQLVLTVFEKDLEKLSPGMKLLAYSNANPDKKYTGTIRLISKGVSDKNAGEVRCQFDGFDSNLLPGMFMNADIELSVAEHWVLPADAVVRYGNKHFVFVMERHNTFRMEEVIPGTVQDGFIQLITTEARKSQTFAIKGAYSLLMALKNVSDD